MFRRRWIVALFCTLTWAAACQGSQTQASTTQSPRAAERVIETNDDQTPDQREQRSDDRIEVPDGFDVQGHRGARGLKPENTLPAFETALDLEVDTLEFDLHLSKNDRLVIWHDPHVYASKCTSTAAKTPVQLRATTEEEAGEHAQVRRLATGLLGRFCCDKNPSPQRFPRQDPRATKLAGANYQIITLEKLFDFVDSYANSSEKTDAQRANADSVRFNIETKRDLEHPEYIGDDFDGTSPATFERKLVALVREHGLVDRVTVQSFVPASLWAVHQIEPQLRLAVLEKSRNEPLADYAKRGAKVWSPRASLVDEASINEAREAGLQVKPWTVNDVDQMRRLIELGVDGIITDRPDLLSKRNIARSHSHPSR